MTPTTVPAPTRTPHEYLADAIADHYRRHGADRAKTAAFELAVTLTAALGLTGAQANALTDALDRLAWGGQPSAGRLAVNRDPLLAILDALDDDDEGDVGSFPPAHEYDGPAYDREGPQS